MRRTRELREAYDRGERDFEFDSGIYGAKSVKNRLIKAQHKKCCFCEARITHVSYGDVEHFRPKGGYRQEAEDDLAKPGYYWLAYDWSNLFLSCQICNQRFKRNFFPLIDPGQRATSHQEDIKQEEPLFVNPADDEPEDFIGFREEFPFAVNGNRRGDKTITAIGLERTDLEEMRRDRLKVIRLAQGTVEEWTERQKADPSSLSAEERRLLRGWKDFLDECTQDGAQFASMARAALGV